MKVVFMVPNLGAGGAERVVSILSKELVNREYEVDIILMLDDLISYKIDLNVNIIKLDYTNTKISYRVKQLRDYIKKQNKKLIFIPFHDSCLKSILLARVGLQAKVIACERNNPYLKGTSILKKYIAKLPFLLSNACVFQTIEAAQYYGKCIRKKSEIIYNPLIIDENLKWRGEKNNVFISIGRLEKQKNQKLLINAFAKFVIRYPEYILEIYGEGSLRNELESLIDNLNLSNKVFLRGIRSDVLNALANGNIFILSSDYEGMSNALIEAMALGMPVISTDHPIGGAKALISNNINGVLVPVNDESRLVEEMDNLVKNSEFAKNIGNNAFKVRELLSINAIIEQWIKLF